MMTHCLLLGRVPACESGKRLAHQRALTVPMHCLKVPLKGALPDQLKGWLAHWLKGQAALHLAHWWQGLL